TQQSGRLRRVVHSDADHAQCPSIEPLAAAQAGRVFSPVRIVADEKCLRLNENLVSSAAVQAGPGVSDEKVRQRTQSGLSLVLPVLGSAYQFSVGAERGVVHEWPAVDGTEVNV